MFRTVCISEMTQWIFMNLFFNESYGFGDYLDHVLDELAPLFVNKYAITSCVLFQGTIEG